MHKKHKRLYLASLGLASLGLAFAMASTPLIIHADSLPNTGDTSVIGHSGSSVLKRSLAATERTTEDGQSDYSDVDISHGHYIHINIVGYNTKNLSVKVHLEAGKKYASFISDTQSFDLVNSAGKTVSNYKTGNENTLPLSWSTIHGHGDFITVDKTDDYTFKLNRNDDNTDATVTFALLEAVKEVDLDSSTARGDYENNGRAFVVDTSGGKSYSLNTHVIDDNPNKEHGLIDSYKSCEYTVSHVYNQENDQTQTEIYDDTKTGDTPLAVEPNDNSHRFIAKEKPSKFDIVQYDYYGQDKFRQEISASINYFTPTVGDVNKHQSLLLLSVFDRVKSFLADPVDTYSGAFTDSRSLLSYGGANGLTFTLNYNSIANNSSALGKGGYTHNFETKIVNSDNLLKIMWSPNSESDFNLVDGQYVAVDSRQSTTKVTKTANSYQVDLPKSEQYTFDKNGLMLTHDLGTGTKLSFTYKNSLLTKVSNNRNQWFALTYDSDKQLSTVTDISGRKLTFNYNTSGLNQVITPDDKNFDISYNGQGKVSQLSYDDKPLVANEYNARGAIVKQTDNKGIETTFDYDDYSNDNQVVTKVTTNGNTVTQVHDKQGNLLSQTDENGHQTSYQYNDKNLQVAETDANGHTTKSEYDDSNNLVKQISATGATITFAYNNGQATDTTTPDGKTVHLEYANNKLVKSVNKLGQVTAISYDKFGNPLTIDQPNDKISYTYDTNGYTVGVTKNGVTTKFVNDKLGRPIQTILPDGSVTKTSYDTNNNVLKTTKPDGTSVTNEYSAIGDVVKSTNEKGVETTNDYDDNGNLRTTSTGDTKVEYTYDDSNRVVSTAINGQTNSTADYDKAGQVVKSTDANGTVTETKYNAVGLVAERTTGSSTIKYSYDDDNQLISTTDGNGGVTKLDYDNAGNVIRITTPTGQVTNKTYDALNRVITTETSGVKNTFSYDEAGNLATQTDGNGNVTKFEYNANHQLTKTINALGQVTTNEYNALGQLSTTKDNRGRVTATYVYNVNGLLSKLTDGNGNSQTFTYDATGNLLESKDAYGNTVSSSEYDDNNRVVTTINALNQKSSVRYDNYSFTTSVTDANGQNKSTTTNADGQLVSAQDSLTDGAVKYNSQGQIASQELTDGKNKTSYGYDNNGNVTSESNNDSSVKYSYNADGIMNAWTNARNQTTQYTLDDKGQVTGAQAVDYKADYTYDNNGNELTAVNDKATVTKTYDALNRVVTSTTNGKTVRYDYDDVGNVSKLTYPDGKTVTYDYDVMGRMSSVTDWDNHKTTYSYDKNNRIVATNYFNGVIENRSYDKAGQVTDIKTLKGSAVLDNHHYEYDSNGNLIKGDTSYEYDNSNRLTSGLSTYAYDNVGNITTAGNNSFSYDDDSRLTTIDGNSTVSDSDGNLTNYTLNGTFHKAQYNSQNQLTDFDDTHYDYDADGNRLYSGVVYANGQLLSDSKYTYVYGANGLVSFANDRDTYINAYNNRGDVTKTFDSNGSVSGTIKYSDYGAVTSQNGVVSTFKYAGQHGAVTDDNGLVYLKTRYYNPQLMRFMNRDTVAGSITDSQSLNRFSYVEGNPLTYVDLNGQARTWLSSYNGMHTMLDALGFIPILGNVTAVLSIGLDIATGHYDAILGDAMGLLPMGHIIGAVGGIAVAHFASPLIAKLGAHVLAHSSILKSGILAGGIRKVERSIGSKGAGLATKFEVAIRPNCLPAVINNQSAKILKHDVNLSSTASFSSSEFNAYLRDVENWTNREINSSQLEIVEKHLNDNKYTRLSKSETDKHRRDFNKVKDSLIAEWEEKTGETWPRYEEDIMSKSNPNKVARHKGDAYDAHHLIENSYGGEHEWWNIHPARFPNEHQGGIHGKSGLAKTLFKR